MTRRAFALPAAAAALAALAWAVAPRSWTFRGFDEFLRGTFDGVSISSEGVLSLAPREDRIEGPAEDFVLSFVVSADGVGYLGTGHEGRIYRIPKTGAPELLFRAPEMDVTCLALGASGTLYAGTSPNGKIYKIAGTGKGEELFNPQERYVWDLLVREDGSLLAAVGESGGIYEISPQGSGRLFFRAEPNHILCLRRDRNGDLLAGSGGNGRVYKISKSGQAGVLFETPYEEVRSLAFDAEGFVYAAAGGTPARGRKEDLAPAPAAKEAEVVVSVSAVAAAPAGGAAGLPSQAAAPGAKPAAPAAGREPGAVFKVSPDGTARRLWGSAEELPYSLAWDESGKRVLFGTGPKGRLYAVSGDGDASLVLQKPCEQIVALVPSGPRFFLLAGNPAGLSVLLPERRTSGEFLGPALDAKIVSAWGRIDWDAVVPQGATLQLQTRSGNTSDPGAGWSDWSPPYAKAGGEPVLSPPGRFVQFRALFKSQAGQATAGLSRAALSYLQTNVPPLVTRLELLPANEVLLKPPDLEEAILGAERRAPFPAQAAKDETRFVAVKKASRQGYRTATWDAEDDNGDALAYSVSIRMDGEKAWRALEDGWTETTFAFQTGYFPDGVYVLKVSASDRPSNPPDREKRGERTSPSFVVDNTAPAVRDLKVAREGGEIVVSFTAADALSPIKDARLLVRPGDWIIVFPEDGLADGPQESFKARWKLPPGADDLLTILIRDAVDNAAVVRRIY